MKTALRALFLASLVVPFATGSSAKAETVRVPQMLDGRSTVVTHFGQFSMRKQSNGNDRTVRFLFDNRKISGAFLYVGMSVRFGAAKTDGAKGSAGDKGAVPVALTIRYSTENRPGTWTTCRRFSHLYVRGAPGVDFEVTCQVAIRPGNAMCQGVWFRFESEYFKPELLEKLTATFTIHGVRRVARDATCK